MNVIRAKFANSNSPGSFGYAARTRRMAKLTSRFPDFADMHIVDLGGDTRFWRVAPARPGKVTIVAIEDWALRDPEPWMDCLLADACDASSIPGRYDLAFSNSVIEHVGGPRYRRGFAETVRGLADRYWVQTPYRYFPLEPHLMFPAFQFLPPKLKVEVAERWPLSQIKGKTDAIEPVAYVMDHELLTVTEMSVLFPDAELVRERVGGITKSLVAVKD